MTWRVEWDDSARRELRRLDHTAQMRILRFTGERLRAVDDPRQLGSALSGALSGLWRYRVGDFRIICRIEDDRLVVLVVSVGDRKDIYR